MELLDVPRQLKPMTSSRVRFYLDGELHELADVDPTRTVLQFLREDLGRTGSKEGCAEGDCGACTVVVAALEGDRLTLQPVNSCIQFLPTLDGRELFTVESLARGERLHPVQQAMVECHGSQCGFCTPGFVMSLFALYKNEDAPERRRIDDALAGNLCRCTGYRPIVSAANRMYELDRDDDWLQQPAAVDDPERRDKLAALRRDSGLAIETAGRRYFAPVTLAELLDVMAAHPQATVLAGGTDVGLWVTKQFRELDTVVYIGNVAELHALDDDDGALRIGAAVSLEAAAAAIVARLPGLDELFRRFASPPIRAAGTLGGNVANGSPIGDSMPALLALDAEVELASSDGPRRLPLDAFYLDYMKKDLRPGEVLVAVRIPLPATGGHVRAYKLSKRFDQDISAVCMAFALQLDDDGRATRFRAGCGGVAAIPRRATRCEEAVIGQAWNDETLAAACAALDEEFEPISDMRASADYRRRVARNVLRRFYLETTGAAGPTVYGYGR